MARLASRSLFAVLPMLCAHLVGCGQHPQHAPKLAVASGVPGARAARPVVALESAPQRRVGDLFIHRFSGSFAQEPLTLTEQVTAEEDAAWVVDFALSQNEQVQRLRVRFDRRSGHAVSAARLQGTTESPAKLSDYDALMARTVYAADVNEGLVSSVAQTCLVGTDALDCETKTYKVWIGERAATLSVVHARAFADRDVSGEITTDDGKLVYRAELIEAKQGKPARGVASR